MLFRPVFFSRPDFSIETLVVDVSRVVGEWWVGVRSYLAPLLPSNELGPVNKVLNGFYGLPTDVAPPEDVGVPLNLLDAILAGMAVTGFVLSGIEYIDGCAYALSWWGRLE